VGRRKDTFGKIPARAGDAEVGLHDARGRGLFVRGIREFYGLKPAWAGDPGRSRPNPIYMQNG